MMNRREVTGALVALSFGGSTMANAKSLDGKTIVFASAGGSYQDAEKVSYCDPFTAKTGATVVQDGPALATKIRGMIQSGVSNWDVVDVSMDLMYNGIKEGLFEKIDRTIVHTSRIDPRYLTDYGVGVIVYSRAIGYNTKRISSEAPKTWADVFDLKRFPGQRMLPNEPVASLEAALLADGVARDKLYPLDLERAFKKLDEIKSNTVFWQTSAQSQQLLVDGEVGLGLILNGRAYDVAKKGASVAISWQDNMQAADYFVVPRGSKNVTAAMGLIDEMTIAENQAKMADLIAYAPTNPEAYKAIKPEVLPWLATAPDNAAQGFLINAEYYRENLKSLQERWLAWRRA